MIYVFINEVCAYDECTHVYMYLCVCVCVCVCVRKLSVSCIASLLRTGVHVRCFVYDIHI